MPEGELRLTGDSFDKLKNSINDLSSRAKIARDSLESLFLVGYGKSYSEDIGKVANHFAKLEELIDGVNNKLSITGAFMRDIFGGHASGIKDIAKALGALNRVSTGGGGRRGGGGGGGLLGGEGDEEKDASAERNYNLLQNVKFQDKQKELLRKATAAYYKEQTAAEEKIAKARAAEDQRLKKAVDTYRKEQVAAEEAVSKLKTKQSKEEDKAWWKRLSNLRAEEKAAEKFAAQRKAAAEKARANRTPFFEDKFNKLVEMGRRRFYMSQVMGNNFGGAAGTFGGNGQGMLSRFGPGLLGILGRYRVFQKPFPGSERNVFSLGDIAAAGQNIVSGAGGSVQRSFDTLTSSAFAVNRAFGGVVAAAASLAPGLGPTIGAAIGVLTDVVVGVLEKLSQAVSGVIGGLTRMATALAGFATRAVEAAANFTEAVNAARVVSGPGAANSMQSEALRLQREFGLSATDLMRGMGRIAGQLRQQAGFSPEEAGQTAQVIARQIADIASVNNVPVENVMRDFMSAIVGRLTPLRKNMISSSAQQLDMMAKSQGMKNPLLRTDLVARVKVMIQEFARQGELFTGDLEKTRYEFANQRRKFLGGFEALFMTVGRILEPFAKAVLIVANDLMDSVFDTIAPFAEDPYTAFKKSIESFAYYVLYAKNVVVSLAQSLYDSRNTILEYAQFVGKSFLQVTLSLVRYSANTLDLFGKLLIGISGLLPAIELLGSALLALSKFISSKFPTEADAKKSQGNYNMGVVEGEIKRLEALRKFAEPGKREGIDSQIAILERQRAFLKTSMANAPADEASPMQKLLLGTGDSLQNTAQSLESFQKQFVEVVQSLEGAGVNSDELKSLLKKLEPALSVANPIQPAPPLSMAGNLVRYFSPEAFRDNIQEREVQNAQIQTAQNTARIASILEKHPLAALPSIAEGGAGVLNRMVGKEAVVSKP